MAELITYSVMRGPEQPPIEAQGLDYLLAANGVFVRGRREGMEVCLPFSSLEGQQVRMLHPASPYVKLDYPRVPEEIVEWMLGFSRHAVGEDMRPVEALFHIWWQDGAWQMHVPEQRATAGSVIPLGPAIGSSYERALIEVHSHHNFSSFFSKTDDRDETGFRIYGVLGEIFERPTLRVRAGLHGYHWEIPASEVFELPAGLWEAQERTLRGTRYSRELEDGDAIVEPGLPPGAADNYPRLAPVRDAFGRLWRHRFLAGPARHPAGQADRGGR